MAPVVEVTRDSLSERRSAILGRLGLSQREFFELVASRTLTGEEWEAKDELQAIEFLLGEDRTDA